MALKAINEIGIYSKTIFSYSGQFQKESISKPKKSLIKKFKVQFFKKFYAQTFLK